MICPKCGKDQPIAELCAQCGANLFMNETVQLTEETPLHWGTKFAVIVSLLVAGLGIYWLSDAWRLGDAPPGDPNLSVGAPRGPANHGASHAPTPALRRVLAVTKLGEVDPKLLREFENGLKGEFKELSFTTVKSPLTQLSEEYKEAPASVVVAIGRTAREAAEEAFQKNLFSASTEVVIVADFAGALPAKAKAIVTLRPRPDLVVRAVRGILKLRSNHPVVLFDPAADESYATDLYGAVLAEQLKLDLIEIRSAQTMIKTLEKISAEADCILLLDSPSLDVPVAVEAMRQMLDKRKLPLVVVGPMRGGHSPVLTMQAAPAKVGAQVRALLDHARIAGEPVKSLPGDGLDVRLFTDRAHAIDEYQAETYAKVLGPTLPEMHFQADSPSTTE